MLLFHRHFSDVFHVWVHSDPENRGLKVFDLKYVLCLDRVVFEFQVVKAKLPLIVVYHVRATRCALRPLIISRLLLILIVFPLVAIVVMFIHLHRFILLLLVLYGLLDFGTQRDVNSDLVFAHLQRHLLLLC